MFLNQLKSIRQAAKIRVVADPNYILGQHTQRRCKNQGLTAKIDT